MVSDKEYSIQPYGDQAILVSLGNTIDSDVNSKIHFLKALMAYELSEYISFQIPAYSSLTIGFKSDLIDFLSLKNRLELIISNAKFTQASLDTQPLLNIPVCYEREFSPDMHEVCELTGLTKKEIIDLHTSIDYQAYMLGFLPGFVYLGKSPLVLKTERKREPRVKVPKGAVGLAGLQSGIYPSEAPGGWQIIGNTPLPLYTLSDKASFLFAPGDRVKFHAVSKQEYTHILALYENKAIERDDFIISKSAYNETSSTGLVIERSLQPKKTSSTNTDQTSTLTIDVPKPGLMTSIQDGGRQNYRSLGVPVGGAMDKTAAAQANYLVGNDKDEPVIEVTLLGPSLTFSSDCQIAITGAHLTPLLDGRDIAMNETIQIETGQCLSFGKYQAGCRAYIAIGGQWKCNKVMGSVSGVAYTDVSSILKKGDQIKIEARPAIVKKTLPIKGIPDLTFPKTIRITAGPEFELFSRQNIASFFSKSYTIGLDSNRMGYRLKERIPDFKPKQELVSSGVIPGTIQITNEGQPIILMADAQTTGGYYRIANVVTEDLSLLAQAKPGDELSFCFVG